MSGVASSKALIELDLKNTPLGQAQNEANLQTPFNATAVRARVYVVNNSATVKRRAVKVGVSSRRGAREALAADPSLRKDFTVQAIYDEAAKGRDMNVYHDVVQPVLFKMQFNGREFLIYPAKIDKDGTILEEAQPHLIPEGLWDLFLGNYDRMHSSNPDEVAEEMQRLAVAWTQRHNPVQRVVAEGREEPLPFGGGVNPFGFLEFHRVVEKEAPQVVDKEFLTALELAEA